MKKTLLAVAVASAFSSAAFAQSNVTLYGVVDAGLQVTDVKAGTTGNPDPIVGLNSGIQSGSRWGFRGHEDLGGGLKAIFTLEGGYSADTGLMAQSSRLFGRQAYVGVTSDTWGTLIGGRQSIFSSGTGDQDKFGRYDICGSGCNYLGMQSVVVPYATRYDNMLTYMSPKIAGFSFGWGHSFQLDGQETSGNAPKNNHADDLYVDFVYGKFTATVTYDRWAYEQSTTAAALANEIEEHWMFGANYDFGVVKLAGAYAKDKNLVGANGLTLPVGASALQRSGADATAYSIVVKVPYGAHEFAANFQGRSWDATATTGSAKRQQWGFLYQYDFSRRTNLYAYYTDGTDKDAAKSANSGGAVQYALGLRHRF